MMPPKYKHELYDTWRTMHRRCYSPKAANYKRYGGRGIIVCDRWHDFWFFVEDMWPKPHNTTLDRIDNSGIYSPQNCRWATPIENANNRGNNKKIEYNGEIKTVTEWARYAGIKVTTLERRLKHYGIEAALFTPTSKLAIGERAYNSKITDEQARAIKYSDEPGCVLARRFGVTSCCVSAIRKNREWKHI